MSNTAIIFAGGVGSRMNSRSKPKQFLELHGKPILIYTLEQFDRHPEIDTVILVVLKEYIPYCEELIRRFFLRKVKAVIAGGDTAIASQRLGLEKAKELGGDDDTVVLIHDGVRPLIDAETISANIASVRERGSAITVTPAIETITVRTDSGEIGEIIERSKCEYARAPQSFFLGDILTAHHRAEEEGLFFIDSASLMKHYGYKLFSVIGSPENIKITTPNDYYTFRALVDAREDSQIFGL